MKQAIRQAAYASNKAMVAHSATYVKDGTLKYVRFETPVPVRSYGRDLLRGLGDDWAAFAEGMELGKTYAFAEASLPPLVVVYERKERYALVLYVEVWDGAAED